MIDTQSAAGSLSRRSPARTRLVLSVAFTLGLLAFLVWTLWPTGPLRIRAVSVDVRPSVLVCSGQEAGDATVPSSRAEVLANVATNGNPGSIYYRWERSGHQRSAVLRQGVSSGQHSVQMHLRWRFSGHGHYTAVATLRITSPVSANLRRSYTVHFTYRCP